MSQTDLIIGELYRTVWVLKQENERMKKELELARQERQE